MNRVGISPIIIASALLSGCGHYCPAPGLPSAEHQSCVYSLTIKDINSDTNLVVGRDGLGQDHTFRVRDIEILTKTKQLETDKDYLFSGLSNSPYLELFPAANETKIRNKLRQ